MGIAATRSTTAATVTAAAIFLLLMDRVAVAELPDKVPPVPGDCSPTPYRRPTSDNDSGESDENNDTVVSPSAIFGGLHLDCLLSAINSDAERTNFSVIPAEHRGVDVFLSGRYCETNLQAYECHANEMPQVLGPGPSIEIPHS